MHENRALGNDGKCKGKIESAGSWSKTCKGHAERARHEVRLLGGSLTLLDMNISVFSLKGIWLSSLIQVRPGGERPEQWLKLTFQIVVPTLEDIHIYIYLLNLKSHHSLTDSVCNSSFSHRLLRKTTSLSLNGSLSVCQTESPRTGRPSCAQWSTWSTMTTLATRHRQETPCEGRLTGKCTTSEYPSLWSCRRKTPVNPLSEFSSSWHIVLLLAWVVHGFLSVPHRLFSDLLQTFSALSVKQLSSELRRVPLLQVKKRIFQYDISRHGPSLVSIYIQVRKD